MKTYFAFSQTHGSFRTVQSSFGPCDWDVRMLPHLSISASWPNVSFSSATSL